jgi:hypothetical protein
MHIG